MIRATAGAELCASHDKPNPKASSCAKAIDHTHQGDVDLSNKVVVGEPVQKDSLHWAVPYNVKDDAGNEATTVWRDVIVQEVDLATVERNVRKQMEAQKDAEIKQAVQKAIREERAKIEKEQKVNSRSTNGRRNSQNSCPSCPSCDCPSDGGAAVSQESCRAYCDDMSRSCSLSDDSTMYWTLFLLEDFFPPSLVPVILGAAFLFLGFILLRFLAALLFGPRSHQHYDYGMYGNESDERLLRSPAPMQSPAPPPRESLSTKNDAFFSPPRPSVLSPTASNNNNRLGNSGMTPQQQPPSANRQVAYDESIYNSPPLITPSRNGDGFRRRNPYT
jgi:hypothetical protein